MYTKVALVLFLALIVVACVQSSGEEDVLESDQQQGECGAGSGFPDGCLGLGEQECSSNQCCTPLYGSPLLNDCSHGPKQYAGCWTGFTFDIGSDSMAAKLCATLPAYGREPSGQAPWVLFPEQCIPDGWEFSEANPIADCNR